MKINYSTKNKMRKEPEFELCNLQKKIKGKQKNYSKSKIFHVK